MPRVSWERLQKMAGEMLLASEEEKVAKMDGYREELKKHNPDLWEYLAFEAISVSNKAVVETLGQWGVGLLVLMGMHKKEASKITRAQIKAVHDKHLEGEPAQVVRNIQRFLVELKAKEPVIHGVLKSYSGKSQGWRGVELSEKARWTILLVCSTIVRVVLEAWQKEEEKEKAP